MGNPMSSTSAPTLGKLGIPKEVQELVARQTGRMIVFSETSKIVRTVDSPNYINQNQYKKIVTLEGPIEYQHGKSHVV